MNAARRQLPAEKTNKPSAQTNKPSTPIYNQSAPVYKPSAPIYKPSAPIYKSSTPINKPSTRPTFLTRQQSTQKREEQPKTYLRIAAQGKPDISTHKSVVKMGEITLELTPQQMKEFEEVKNFYLEKFTKLDNKHGF